MSSAPPSKPSAPSLLATLVAKELRELYQSPRFAVTYAVVSVLVLLTFGLAASQYQQSRSEYEAVRSEALRQLEGRTDWQGLEPLVQRPPTPLESLVNGVAHDLGRHARVRPGASIRLAPGLYAERPLMALWRFLDLDFLFRVVLSLFAVLFAFDAISGEKAQGTLRLALSSSVPRPLFVTAKLLGSFAGIALPLLVPLLGGVLLLLGFGVPLAAADGWRLGAVVGAGLLYLAAFLGLSLLVSSRTHRPATSFLVLLVIWITVVLVIPRSAALLAGRAVPVPSVDEASFQRSRLAAQLFREDRQAMAELLGNSEGQIRIEVDLESGEDPATAVAQFQAKINATMREREDERRRRIDALDAELAQNRRNAESRRNAWALSAARLSPAATFSLAASELAGTSLDLGDRFVTQARAYRDTFETFVREKEGSAGGGIRIMVASDDGTPPEAEAIDPTEMPRFRFRGLDTAEALSRASGELVILFLFAALFYTGAFVSFLHYDPR